MVDENSKDLAGEEITDKEGKMIKDSITLLSDLDKLTIHSRREGAVLRSSVHFKTR